MSRTIKRKSQRAGGGCTWRNGSSRKNSVRKMKMKMRGGGAHHNHPKGRGRSMRGGGCGGKHPKGRGRSMRGGGYGVSGSSWGKIPKRRSMRKLSQKRKKFIVVEENPRKRR